jgi:hypothetical protein
MSSLKHVGRLVANKRRVVVAYRVVPNEPENCIIVSTESLEAADHDSLIKLVESPAGQEATELADAMMRTPLSDGSNMLARFHITGKLVKVPTKSVEMIPNSNTTILLSDLNEAIAARAGITVTDLAVKGKKTAAPAVVAEATAPIQTVAATDDGVLTDEMIAAKYRSDADRLSKEAAALRRQAEELVPTKKASAKKTASA